MAQTSMTADDDSPVDSKKVFLNVLSGLTILASVAMAFLGIFYMDNCPSEPSLPIALIIQGCITITMPIWFVLKYRLLAPIKRNLFLSVFFILFAVFFASLIACTIFFHNSGCEESEVYKATLAFVVVLWIVSLIYLITSSALAILELCEY